MHAKPIWIPGFFALLLLVLPVCVAAQGSPSGVWGPFFEDERTITIAFTTQMNAAAGVESNYTLSGPGQGTLAQHPDAVDYDGNVQIPDYGYGYQYTLTWDSGAWAEAEILELTLSHNIRNVPFDLPIPEPDNVLRLRTPGPNTVRVFVWGETGSDDDDGSSWETAFETINAAVEMFPAEIWVHSGVYPVTEPVDIPGGTAIYGGFSGSEDTPGARLPGAMSMIDVQVTGDYEAGFRIGGLEGDILIDGFDFRNAETYAVRFMEDARFLTPIFDNVVIQNCRFYQNDWAVRGNVAVDECVFEENRKGGVVSVYLIKNSDFLRNEGDLISYNVSLPVENCLFQENGSMDAIALISGANTIRNCVFRWNTDCGLVYSPKLIEECEFDTNVRAAIYQPDALRDCTFTGNYGSTYGIVQYAGLVERCLFIDNHAGVMGGAIYRVDTVVDCLFEENSAVQKGGAIYRSGEIRGSTFRGNYARQGGAVMEGPTELQDSELSESVIEFCDFYQNAAVSGGAIYGYNWRTRLRLSHVNFTGNYAFSQGGAIFTAEGNHRADNCCFAGNGATITGGAWHLDGSNVSVVASIFDRNKSIGPGSAVAMTGHDGIGGHLVGKLDLTYSSVTNSFSSAIYEFAPIQGDSNDPARLTNCVFDAAGEPIYETWEGTTFESAFLLHLYGYADNVDIADFFVMDGPGAVTGTWSSVSFDPETNRTTLTDDTAPFPPNHGLATRAIVPDDGHPFMGVIQQNTASSIVLIGNFAQPHMVQAGDTYRLADYTVR